MAMVVMMMMVMGVNVFVRIAVTNLTMTRMLASNMLMFLALLSKIAFSLLSLMHIVVKV